ncbi:MAG: hypothetical protein ACE5KZ_03080 [Candidatus Scalinduaceae bacterium]
MYTFKSKQRFKKLSILVLVPYFILCITAGGFHAFDETAYHTHYSDSNHPEKTDLNGNNTCNKKPILCYNDHSADECSICKWLKNTPKRFQISPNKSHIIPDASRSFKYDQLVYFSSKASINNPRSPPSTIS